MRTTLCVLLLLSPVAFADPEAEVRAYLMECAGAAGIRPWLERNRVTIGGWLEQSFTANPEGGDVNELHVFDDGANAYRLNQLYVSIERALPEGSAAGWGGKVALLYGSDARFIHERGLADEQNASVQFDPQEFFLTGRIPVGGGIAIKAGKMDTPIGSEVIEGPANLLYSHSYQFNFAIPFTHTGLMATWSAAERVDVAAGAFLGWDVWDDQNDSLSYHLGLTVRGADPANSFSVQAVAGPEQPGNDSDVRTVVDAVWRRAWTDRLSTVVDAVYGVEEEAAAGSDARWYGVAAYATRRLDGRMSATLRAEWFRDDGGTRVGFDGDILALTVGVDWRPAPCLPNLRIRPEVRWDHAPGDEPFDGGTRADQFTLALDVIFTF
jgi:hypothetical protein